MRVRFTYDFLAFSPSGRTQVVRPFVVECFWSEYNVCGVHHIEDGALITAIPHTGIFGAELNALDALFRFHESVPLRAKT